MGWGVHIPFVNESSGGGVFKQKEDLDVQLDLAMASPGAMDAYTGTPGLREDEGPSPLVSI